MAKLRFSTTQQIIDAFPVLREEFASSDLDSNPVDFAKGLVESSQHRQALAVCAFMLPRREAVGWLCDTLRQNGGELNKVDETLLKLAEDWVQSPAEKNRMAAMKAVMTSGFKTAPAWAAAAAAWSGGSMSDNPDLPAPPPAHLTGQAVKMGQLLAFWNAQIERRETRVGDTIDRAIAIAQSD